MALSATSCALRVALKRPCHFRGGLLDPSRSVALLRARPTQQHRQAAAALHSSTMLLDRGDKRGESHNSSVDNGGKKQDKGSADESTPSSVRSVSMTDKDKPDVVDLADLIMSGTSYKEAVAGTEFDALDKETSEEFEASSRRLTALRENRLEEYLEETGETDLLDKVRAIYGEPETSDQTDGPVPPKKKKTVEMAQGQWAEILVHTDRVTKTVKGGMEIQYRALVTVGNLHGVGGFAIGKADTPAVAITEASRKAKLLHNLVYVERYKQASLCQDLVGKHNGSKVYIWSRPPGSGMRAGKLSRDILYNMGITDGACKIIGRRNKYSMIYAMFDA
ncbi:unnamed protein product, partial [Ectocarpus sp. 12 AP-2014]